MEQFKTNELGIGRMGFVPCSSSSSPLKRALLGRYSLVTTHACIRLTVDSLLSGRDAQLLLRHQRAWTRRHLFHWWVRNFKFRVMGSTSQISLPLSLKPATHVPVYLTGAPVPAYPSDIPVLVWPALTAADLRSLSTFRMRSFSGATRDLCALAMYVDNYARPRNGFDRMTGRRASSVYFAPLPPLHSIVFSLKVVVLAIHIL